MANKEVPLLYNEYRLRALENALEENGSSVELALKYAGFPLPKVRTTHRTRGDRIPHSAGGNCCTGKSSKYRRRFPSAQRGRRHQFLVAVCEGAVSVR